MGTVYTLIMLILWLIIVPILIGIIPAGILPERRRSLVVTFIAGYLLSLAVFEIVAIPCMLFITYSAFSICVKIYSAIEIALAIAGFIIGIILINKKKQEDLASGEINSLSYRGIKHRLEAVFPGEQHVLAEDYMDPRGDVYGRRVRYSTEGKILWVIFAVFVLFQLYMAFFYASFDGDDAYYVVESVLAVQTDTMNTILPYTGGSTTLDIRHALAVITMWIAFIAKMSGVHATILAHTLLPLFLIPLTYAIYLEIGRMLFRKDPNKLPMFMIIMAVFQMFGHTSISTAETFFLTRTWQGKSMLANIAIPLIIWLFLWIGEDLERENRQKLSKSNRFAPWMLMILVNMASGIFSSMGVMFGTILIGACALVLIIRYKKLSVALMAAVVCIPNVIYLLMYLCLLKGYWNIL